MVLTNKASEDFWWAVRAPLKPLGIDRAPTSKTVVFSPWNVGVTPFLIDISKLDPSVLRTFQLTAIECIEKKAAGRDGNKSRKR